MSRCRFSLLLLAMLLIGCTSTVTPTSPKTQVVVLWHPFSDSRREALQVLSDRFNTENPDNITLVLEYQEDIYTKVIEAEPAHRPDIIITSPEEAGSYHAAGVTQPLDSINADIEDLLPMAEALYKAGDTLEAIPLGLATYVLYYNTEWVRDLGYDATTMTLRDLQQAACDATSLQGQQTGLGIAAQPGTSLILLAANSLTDTGDENVEDLNQVDTTASTILQETLSAACGHIYEIPTEGTQQFSNGAVAMMIDTSTRYRAIQQAVDVEHNFSPSARAVPTISESGQPATLWYGPGLILIASENNHVDNTQKVLAWFLSPDVQLAWSTTSGYLPVRYSLVEERMAFSETPALEKDLLNLAMQAANEETWNKWPTNMYERTCRAALVRGLIELNSTQPVTDILNAMINTCTIEALP